MTTYEKQILQGLKDYVNNINADALIPFNCRVLEYNEKITFYVTIDGKETPLMRGAGILDAEDAGIYSITDALQRIYNKGYKDGSEEARRWINT